MMHVTRREFVKRSSAVALPLILPAAALGRGRAAPSERIGLGFIGMGVMNRHHLGRFLDNEAVRVLAVCDVDATRREHAKSMVDDKYGSADCGAYNDHAELLARGDIDAVVISTPDHWHAIQVIDACRAGKDVYCEKPLSLTIREAEAMVDAVRRHGRVLQTGSQQRTEFEGRFRTACEYVRNGRVGKVLTVHVGVGDPSVWCDLPEEPVEEGLDWDRWLGPAPVRPYNAILSPRGIHDHFPMWRLYREYSGGMMTDFGAHHFDIAQWGLRADQSGPVEIIPPRDGGALRGATLVYADGVEVKHGGPWGATFIGTEGMIHVDRGRLISVPEKILDEPLAEDVERLPRAPNHYADWLDCIRTRQRPICDVEVGARSVTVCHLCNLAYWHRRPLRWDPESWRVIGDAEANGWLDYERREPYSLPAVA